MLLEDLKLNMRTARSQRAARREKSAVAPSPGAVEVSQEHVPVAKATGFRAWRRGRPFVGALLTAVAGVEMFFSGQLDVGNIHISVGIEGLQSTVIPVLLVTLAILTLFMPQHRIFYGVISLVVAVYSLIGLNLGGFFIGMILGAVGGILVVSWMPKPAKSTAMNAETIVANLRLMDESELDEADSDDAKNATTEPRPLVLSR